MIEQNVRWLIPALLLSAASMLAQTKCPPLPEGAACSQYHYHVGLWNIEARTFSDVATTTRFVSLAACDKARAEAMRENASLAEFVRTSVDSSMSANRFGDCHCDRTEDAASASFLDGRSRTTQLRSQQDAAWTLRERLLSRETPGIGDRLKNVFAPPPRWDRFLRETIPTRVPLSSVPRPAARLIESSVNPQTPMPEIAEHISLVPVPPIPAAPASQPQAQPATAPPVAPAPAASPAQSSNVPDTRQR